MSLFRLVVGLLMADGANCLLSGGEFALVLSLREFFGARSVAFVVGDVNSVKPIDEVKKSSARYLQSVVIAEDRIEEFANGEGDSPVEKIIFVTKERLHLGNYTETMQKTRSMTWALFGEPLDFDFKGVPVPYDCDVLSIRSGGRRTEVKQLHHVHGEGSAMEKDFGYVAPNGNLVAPDPASFHRDKLNLRNLTVRVGIQSAQRRRRKEKCCHLYSVLDELHFVILKMMAEKLKFREEYVAYHGDKFQYVYPNGSYSGFSKMLLDNEIDIVSASFVMDGKRFFDFDFASPTFRAETMLYLKEDDLDRVFTGTPISVYVWIIIFLWASLTGCVLRVCQSFILGARRKCFVPTKVIHSVLTVLQLAFGQGMTVIPPSPAIRIILSITLMVSLALNYLYSATITSYLTTDDVLLPFKNLKGFLENGKYKIITNPYGYSWNFIKILMAAKGFQVDRYVLREEDLPLDTKQGLDRLCASTYLALMDFRGNIQDAGAVNCKLKEVPNPIITQYFAFALRQNSPYKDYLQPVLLSLQDTGIIAKLGRALENRYTLNSAHDAGKYRSLGLDKTIVMFIILFFGVLIASAAVALEAATRRGNRSNPKALGDKEKSCRNNINL